MYMRPPAAERGELTTRPLPTGKGRAAINRWALLACLIRRRLIR
jgi:hypothetical protein